MKNPKKFFTIPIRTIISSINKLLMCTYSDLKIKFKIKNKIISKVEIGSGPRKREGFSTLDLSWKTDFPYDLNFGLPFKGNSIDLIYCEHVFEHFTESEFIAILDSCYCSLTTNGKLLIAVPNISPMLKAYSSNFEEFKENINFEIPEKYNNNLDVINYMVHLNGEHKLAFDIENLSNYFKNAGFEVNGKREFDETLDSSRRRSESLYFYGIK